MNMKLRIAVISLLSVVLAVSIGFLAKDYCDSKNQAELYDNLIETVEEIDDTQDTMSYSEDKDFLPDYQELYMQNNDNGIKDPEYSIQCGVQELKAALTSAEVESPIDMERIKLALQGYNFGNGYISWAKSKYGGYSYANAVEFSTQQAQRLGWDSYGDTQYPAHVLRYYPYGRAFTAGSNQAIVEVALTQIGNEGGQPYWSWYGFDSRVEWCACFVSWCADQCGYIDSGLIPKFAGCIDGANWFKSNNRWNDRNYEPKAGDIIFFDWEGDGTTDHVGIVEKCENGTVYTVEGNSGDACRQRQYTVGSRNIYGYGIPAY